MVNPFFKFLKETVICRSGASSLGVAFLLFVGLVSPVNAQESLEVVSITDSGVFTAFVVENPLGLSGNFDGVSPLKSVFSGTYAEIVSSDFGGYKCTSSLVNPVYYDTATSTGTFNITHSFHDGGYIGPFAGDLNVTDCTAPAFYTAQFYFSSVVYSLSYYWNGEKITEVDVFEESPFVETYTTRFTDVQISSPTTISNGLGFEITPQANDGGSSFLDASDTFTQTIQCSDLLGLQTIETVGLWTSDGGNVGVNPPVRVKINNEAYSPTINLDHGGQGISDMSWETFDVPDFAVSGCVSEITISANVPFGQPSSFIGGTGAGDYTGGVSGGDTPVWLGDLAIQLSGESIVPVADSLIFEVDYFLESTDWTATNRPDVILINISNSSATQVAQKQQYILPLEDGNSTEQLTVNQAFADGEYTAQVNFWNASSQKFVLNKSYFTVNFEIVSGQIVSQQKVDSSDAIFPTPDVTTEDCGLTNLGGCLNNSIKYLFYPSTESITGFTDSYEVIKGKVPFVYIYQAGDLMTGIYSGTAGTVPTFSVSTGLGEITILSEAMLAGIPYVNLMRTLMGYAIIMMLFTALYRKTMRVHDKTTQL